MIEIRELREKVENYAKDKFGKEIYVFDPIFRKEEEKYYLCYTVLEFIDEANNNYNFIKPNKFILVDIITGEIIRSHEDDEVFKEKEIKNDGSSSLYDSSNHILHSYFEWKNKVISEVKTKFSNIEEDNNPNILLSGGDFISPNSFVIANIEPILDEVHLIIMEKIGNQIQNMYIEYYNYVIDEIRKEYEETKIVKKESVINYINLINYSWPSFEKLVASLNNI